jgi:hypothetical protein
MIIDPVTAGIDAAKSLIDLGGKFIEDKDKRNEFNYKALELANNFALTAMQTRTVPWVDAMVKILLVGRDYIRPIGAALMSAFGAYCHYKGINMDNIAHTAFDMALPAWGASRHVEKQNKIKAAVAQSNTEPMDITGL